MTAADTAGRDHRLDRGGATLRGVDRGAGLPVLFQHGLGGDDSQAEEAFPTNPGLRRLTLECRGHGDSTAGHERPFSIPLFADDVLAFADVVGLHAFVAGGVSMGAAIALRIATRHRDRVRALVLVRPGWLFGAAPPYMAALRAVASALRRMPPEAARAAFAQSPTGRRLADAAPANLKALLSLFERPDPIAMADLYDDIATSDPGVTRAEAVTLRVPTLVIGAARDLAHPLADAEALARTIPGARLIEVPARRDDKAAHLAGTRAAIARFLTELEAPTPRARS